MTVMTLTHERAAELLNDTTIPAAHRALWALLWDGEIRLEEALMLDVRDFNLDERVARLEFRVKPGPDTVPISERAADLLREAFGGETAGPAIHVFGRPLSVSAAARRARAAGVSIHAFRLSGPGRPSYAVGG
ncbi:site-specific integrase [Streptomyces sp. ID01-12c]|nr:site-specific integrase [Streptomyces caniscabiei]